jgi:hypothetical protein
MDVPRERGLHRLGIFGSPPDSVTQARPPPTRRLGISSSSARGSASHTSTRMVDSTYVSLYEDADRAVADAIDDLLRASAVHETDH